MSARYAEILASLVDRVRAYLSRCTAPSTGQRRASSRRPTRAGAVLHRDHAGRSPGRAAPPALAAFTDVLGVDRTLVRGRIIQVDPDDRASPGFRRPRRARAEIAARAAATS